MKGVILLLTLMSTILTGCNAGNIEGGENESMNYSEKVVVVPSIKDKISSDTAWCATFQLVWNDMKDELVGQDVVLTPQLEMVSNLNEETFTEDMISDDYYYKKYGVKSLELKEEIKKGIKEKFNEESEILDLFEWSEEIDENRYFFYTMLKREFEFPKVFDVLETGSFGEKEDGVKYFGIDSNSDKVLREQVKVLFYNSEDEFAVLLETKNGDEVILYKGPEGETFQEIYNNMIEKEKNYKGDKYLLSIDKLKVPYITFKEKREYDEFAGKPFKTADGGIAQIEKAIQTIEFELTEKGGKIKSEAAIDVTKNAIVFEPKEPRNFYVDDTFTMFLREEGRGVPYFATIISDIEKVQE